MSSSHFSVATAIEKDRIASDVAFVVLLAIDVTDVNGAPVQTMHFAKNSEDIIYKGNTYIAANFSVKLNLDVANVPKLEVTADDPTGVIRDMMNLYNGGIGFDVSITVVNTGNLTQSPEIHETFKIVTASQSGYQVSFTMGVDNPLTLRFPNRLQFRDQCTYQYKGTRCKYAGALANCDYTYFGTNGCKVHANTVNYGGFLGLQNLG